MYENCYLAVVCITNSNVQIKLGRKIRLERPRCLEVGQENQSTNQQTHTGLVYLRSSTGEDRSSRPSGGRRRGLASGSSLNGGGGWYNRAGVSWSRAGGHNNGGSINGGRALGRYNRVSGSCRDRNDRGRVGGGSQSLSQSLGNLRSEDAGAAGNYRLGN
jgi:hypothetical protein